MQLRKICVFIVLMCVLSGCTDFRYYSQAAQGQMALWWQARPVAEVIADPATQPRLREALRASQKARDFASRELGLPDNASYRHYADLGRAQVLWNVIATRPDSLNPQPFCPPLVGCMPYQGFFDEAAARAHAAELQKSGLETLVYGVPAYSSLGWFADPLLNTFVNQPEAELAGLIFHELTHQQVFAEHDTAFNESLATFVEEEGTRRWLQGRTQELAAWQARRERGQQIRQLILATRGDLAQLYAAAPPDLRARKAVRLSELRTRLMAIWQTAGAKPRGIWFDEPLGNPHLSLVATYFEFVPGWQRVFEENQSDWPRFWRSARHLAGQPQRIACLQQACPDQ